MLLNKELLYALKIFLNRFSSAQSGFFMFTHQIFYLYDMDFQTKNIDVAVGDFNLKLTIIENIDALFDALIQKGVDHEDVKDERIPYWAELWASAIALSLYLVENQLVSNEKSVTEIGCGLGLPSIVAGLLGAKEVILTDYLPEALDFAKQNWLQNLPEKNARFQVLDWRNPDPSVSADILLASDVAYESRAFEPLLNAFKILLNPNGIILITEPNRYISKKFFLGLNTLSQRDAFGKGINEGYDVKHSTMNIERKGHVFLINIYELRLKCI